LENLKQVIVKKDAVGDWYVCFVCDVKISPDKEITLVGHESGFDFGLKTFLTSSEGQKIESPLFYKVFGKHIAKASKKLSKKIKGSNHRKHARLDLARLHRKIKNKRLNHHFQLAKELAQNNDTIFLEDLNLKGMQRRWGKKINDLGFSNFVNILKHQCEKYGCTLVFIDRWYPSTKTCFDCGYVNHALILKDREWKCPCCGVEHDRDVNAAKNIKRVGASTLAGDIVRLALAS
jgi:putative transposase